MFYLIGIGLCDPTDITVKGLDVVRGASRVYLEAYTSILSVGKEELESFYGCKIILADREMVEQNADEILTGADILDVAFLVVGDPLGATTHSDIIIRAHELGIQYHLIHNASIINAVGCCGLQLYHFGEAVSVPFWTPNWKPDSFVDKIQGNLDRGLHTLCLLDIKVKEQSIKNLISGVKKFEPSRYMSISQAASQLVEVIQNKKELPGTTNRLSASTLCVGLARVGSVTQNIAVDTIENIGHWEFGEPLHSMIIIGEMHPMELAMLKLSCNAEKRGIPESIPKDGM